MKTTSKLRTHLAVAIAAVAGASAALSIRSYVAHAGTSASGSTLAFAGTIRKNGAPVTSQQTLVFRFKKGGTEVCASADLSVVPSADGSFQVMIPIANCPASLFDGSDVTVDIWANGVVTAVDQLIASVPRAKYADQIGVPDCPLGYERLAAPAPIVSCVRGSDEVVKVGSGATAFWVDRYEASVWSDPAGTGTQYGSTGMDYPSTFPQNGQGRAEDNLYALSKSGVQPSAYLTWFQATRACAASGKRLPNGTEWLLAAAGTPDPGNNDGAGGKCRTQATVRPTGIGTICQSTWGAQDMVGNAEEFTNEWWVAPGSSDTNIQTPWSDPSYGNDSTINVVGGLPSGMPSVALRGGSSYSPDPGGTWAGVFHLNVVNGPSAQNGGMGFRCVIPR